jgi:Nucleotidyltransferase domain.
MLMERVPGIVFALVIGSARDGVVKPGSDLDLAVYMDEAPSLELCGAIEQTVLQAVEGDVRVDIGFLNRAEPVYRFEALKGRLLFTHDEERWLRFYSLTCREYEQQMFRYKRQLAYRREREKSCN